MNIAYTEHGQSNTQTIVLLHGGGVAGWMWREQLPALKSYHVIVPDLHGHGESHSLEFKSIEHCAKDLCHFIKNSKKSDQVILVGFSIGAQIALECLNQEPQLISTAVIVSALVKPLKATRLFLSLLKRTFPLLKNRAFAKLQAQQLSIPDDLFEQYYSDSLKMTLSNFLNMMSSNLTYALSKDFKNTAVPTLILVGEKEKKMMRASAEALTANNSNAAGYIVPRAGHDIPLSNPERFNQILLAWIDKKEEPSIFQKI